MLRRTIDTLKRINVILRVTLMVLAGVSLVAMVVMTGIDVVGRKAGMPLPGTYDAITLLCAIATAGALAYTQERKENIVVDILVTHFPKSLKKITHLISDVACLAFIVIVAWQIGDIGLTQYRTGEVTESLGIIFYPITFLSAFGFVTLAMVFVTDILTTLADTPEEPQP